MPDYFTKNVHIYTVYDALSRLASGMSMEEMLDDFPGLKRADIWACLQYAAERESQLPINGHESAQKRSGPKNTSEPLLFWGDAPYFNNSY
ncbi:MAG: DUF433 domain-containing protein [Lewinellaceae bacterium]|nr:DUF433 domain-containing protein [Lewinellaceae bacterium]